MNDQLAGVEPPTSRLTGWAAGVVVLALALTGAVGSDARALVAVGVVVLAWRAARAGMGHPAGGGVVRALGWLAAGMLASLVPMPPALVAWVAPGVDTAHGGGWWFAALWPPDVVEALTTAGWMGLFAVTLVNLRPDRTRTSEGVAWATAAFAVVGAVHALTGTTSLLGVWPVRPVEGRFFAPLIHPNHHGLVLLMGLPHVVARARALAPTHPVAALALGGVAAWTMAYPVVTASMGLVVVLAAMTTCTWWQQGRRGGWITLVAVLMLVVQLGAWVVQGQPEWWFLSGQPRWMQWTDTWALWRASPLAGVGLGTYERAYAAVRTVPTFAVFEHAHSDALEWVAETGLVGLAAVGLAWRALPAPDPGPGRQAWTLTMVAVAVHACVDFPLHVPGVALLAIGAGVVWRYGGAPVAVPRAAWSGRHAVALAGLVGLALVPALRDLAWPRLTSPQVAPFATLFPGHAEAQLARAQAGAETGPVAARFWHHGPTLMRLSAVAQARGDEEEALRLLERAAVRDRNDLRTWWLLADARHRAGLPRGAVAARAEALRHWPADRGDVGAVFEAAYGAMPVGLWWLDALQDAPAHWSVRLAWRMVDEQDWEVALLACEQAGRLRPAAHARMSACADALVGLGRGDEAWGYVRAWTEEAPDNPWAWASRSDVARALGDQEAAAGALVRAWELGKPHPALCRRIRRLGPECDDPYWVAACHLREEAAATCGSGRGDRGDQR